MWLALNHFRHPTRGESRNAGCQPNVFIECIRVPPEGEINTSRVQTYSDALFNETNALRASAEKERKREREREREAERKREK